MSAEQAGQVGFEATVPDDDGITSVKLHIVAKIWGAARTTVSRAVATIKTLGLKIAHRTNNATKKIKQATKSVWANPVRPFLRARALMLAILGAAAGLVVAPVTTLIAVAVVGATVVAAAYTHAYLEESEHYVHRALFQLLNAVRAAISFLVYAAAAAATLLLCVFSTPAAVGSIVELVLRRHGTSNDEALLAYGAVFSFLTGHWVSSLAFLSLLLLTSSKREKFENRTVDANSAASKVTVRVKLPNCQACGEDVDGPRFNLGKHRGLCQGCFSLLAREQARESERKRNSRYEDDDAAIEMPENMHADKKVYATVAIPRNKALSIPEHMRKQLPQVEKSAKDLANIYWAETAWWFDKRGKRYVRQWDGYVGGQVAAVINYDHELSRRGFYVTTPLISNNTKEGPFSKLLIAQEAASRSLTDSKATFDAALQEIQDHEIVREVSIDLPAAEVRANSALDSVG